MSQKWQDFVDHYHRSLARDFSAPGGHVPGRRVHVQVAEKIYVYLYRGDTPVQTQTVAIPERWWHRWPTDATLRRYVHRHATIGSAPITEVMS